MFRKSGKKQPNMALAQMLTELTPDFDFALDATMPFFENQSADELYQNISDDEDIFTEKPSSENLFAEGSFACSPYFDIGRLKGQYTIKNEITGGGMSRVFLAKRNATGNDWIVKFIPKKIGRLSSEIDILKSVNHTNLPTIIDVYENEKGVFFVESYIDGTGLNKVFEQNRNSGNSVKEYMVVDWTIQLAQVLSYLHKLSLPVYHLDLKPSNIIVTPDNKLALIDFGISRRNMKVSGVGGITYSYAAPEQILNSKPSKKGELSIRTRFGTLPENSSNWLIDERTDIYGLGILLFEAIFGEIPTFENIGRLKSYVSKGMYDVITKCLAVDPDDRYQTMDDVLFDVQKQRQLATPTMAQSSLTRKLVGGNIICISALLIIFAYFFFIQRPPYVHTDSNVETVFFALSSETVNIIQIHNYQNEMYAIVRQYDGVKYGIANIISGVPHIVYWAEDYAIIKDLAVHNNRLYFVESHNEGTKTYIRSITTYDEHNTRTLLTQDTKIVSIGVIDSRIYFVDSNFGIFSLEQYME